jgi:hypothetical protein
MYFLWVQEIQSNFLSQPPIQKIKVEAKLQQITHFIGFKVQRQGSSGFEGISKTNEKGRLII